MQPKHTIILIFFMQTLLNAMEFTTRFGPNSPAYNQPLYFEANHMIARPDKKKRRAHSRTRLNQKKYKDIGEKKRQRTMPPSQEDLL